MLNEEHWPHLRHRMSAWFLLEDFAQAAGIWHAETVERLKDLVQRLYPQLEARVTVQCESCHGYGHSKDLLNTKRAKELKTATLTVLGQGLRTLPTESTARLIALEKTKSK